jgi:WD40 repeat protein
MPRGCLVLCLCASMVSAFAAADVPPVSFARDIGPLLAAKCVTCHNSEKNKGGYVLETFESLVRPGESKQPPLVPGHPEKSRIIQLLTTEDEDDRMPQNSEPLPPGQITLIERWIREGGILDAGQSNVPLHTLIATAHPEPPQIYARPLPIRALAFSGDGKELVVGGYHEITFWRCADGKLLRRVPNFAQHVYGIAGHLSLDTRHSLLAVASGTPGRLGQVNLLDANTAGDIALTGNADTPVRAGKVLGTARDIMLAVCFNAAGDKLAAAGADNAIRVYDVETGRQELFIEQHADWILGLSFSPDGTLLASASRDKTARLFNGKTGELESTYVGHSDAVFGVLFAPDSQRVCSAGRDKSLHLWDRKEAKKLDDAREFEGEVLRLVASGDAVFSCGADKKIRQHSVGKKLELARTLSGHEDVIYAMDYHAPSGRLATGSYDGQVRIWDVENGKTTLSFTASPAIKSR